MINRKVGFLLLSGVMVLALALVLVGTSSSFANSEWLVFAGIGLFVLAGAPVLSDLTRRSESSGRRISSNLVALSSAAILAVYAAGYHHTQGAAEQFAERESTPRRRSAPVPASLEARVTPPSALVAPTLGPSSDANSTSLATTSVSEQLNGNTSLAATAASTIASIERETAVDTKAAPAPASPIAQTAATIAQSNEPAPVQQIAAIANPAQPNTAPQATAPTQWEYFDGLYWGWGSCRHGDMQVQVFIEAGKIKSAEITKCQTLYPCTIIKTVPPQVVELQDPDKIDNISGATDSTDAYYDAVIDALNKAVK